MVMVVMVLVVVVVVLGVWWIVLSVFGCFHSEYFGRQSALCGHVRGRIASARLGLVGHSRRTKATSTDKFFFFFCGVVGV